MKPCASGEYGPHETSILFLLQCRVRSSRAAVPCWLNNQVNECPWTRFAKDWTFAWTHRVTFRKRRWVCACVNDDRRVLVDDVHEHKFIERHWTQFLPFLGYFLYFGFCTLFVTARGKRAFWVYTKPLIFSSAVWRCFSTPIFQEIYQLTFIIHSLDDYL
jgi:hypothetical protein